MSFRDETLEYSPYSMPDDCEAVPEEPKEVRRSLLNSNNLKRYQEDLAYRAINTLDNLLGAI